MAYADKNGHVFYSGSDDSTIAVWDRRTLNARRPEPVGRFLGHRQGITFIDSKMDGRFLISNGKDQCIKVRKEEKQDCRCAFLTYPLVCRCAFFNIPSCVSLCIFTISSCAVVYFFNLHFWYHCSFITCRFSCGIFARWQAGSCGRVRRGRRALTIGTSSWPSRAVLLLCPPTPVS